MSNISWKPGLCSLTIYGARNKTYTHGTRNKPVKGHIASCHAKLSHGIPI
jgi:hypothetical protein